MHFKPELEDDIIKLVKLDASHEEALFSIAFDPDLWQYSPTPIHALEDFHHYFQNALSKQAAGEHYVYVVILKAENKIIGSTRHYDISIPHRTLSMGYSWLVHAYRGKGLNIRMKYLLIA